MAWYDYIPHVYAAKKAWGAMDPSKPQQAIEQGAKDAQQGYQNLGQDVWNKTQQGQQQSMAYTQPYAQQVANYGAQTQSPGAFEQSYQSLWNQIPNNSQQRTNDAWSYMKAPSATQQFGQNMSNAFASPSNSQSAYGNISWNSPTASQGAYGQNQRDMVNAPDSAWASQYGRGQLQNSSAADYYKQNQGAFQAPSFSNMAAQRGDYYQQGRTEGFQPGQVNNARNYAFEANQRLAGPSQVQSDYKRIGNTIGEAEDSARSAGMTNTFASRNLPGMERQGIHEQFAQSALQGNNPYLDRIQDQGMKRINQEMARRGHFKSGGADTAIGNFAGEMGARNFQYLGDLTKSGQQMQMDRLGQAQGLAQASDSSSLARSQGLLGAAGERRGLAGQVDQTNLAKEDARARAAGMASNEGMGWERLNLDAAQAADQTRFARLGARDRLAGQADSADLSKLTAGGNMAANADAARLGNIMGIGNLSNMSDTQRLGQMGERRAGASAADSAEAQRRQGYMAGAGQADTSNMQRWDMLGQNAGRQDDQGFRNLNQYLQTGQQGDAMNMARFGMLGDWMQSADAQMRARQQAGVNAYGDLAKLQSGIPLQYNQLGLPLYYGAQEGGINARFNAAQANAAGTAAQQQLGWDFLNRLNKNAEQGMSMYGMGRGGGQQGGGQSTGQFGGYYQPPRR